MKEEIFIVDNHGHSGLKATLFRRTTPLERHSASENMLSKQQQRDQVEPSTEQSQWNFNENGNWIHSLLKRFPSSSPEVITALDSMRRNFPSPPVEIVPGNVWNTKLDTLVIKTHRQSQFEDAIRKVELSSHYL